jgi:hypothetical protein
VSLKSLLSHHPSGCQPVGPVGPTGPTPVAALSGGPTSLMAGAATRPGPMSRAAPSNYAAHPHYSCNTPLLPHNECYQIPFSQNLNNMRKEMETESKEKSGSISLESSITRGT